MNHLIIIPITPLQDLCRTSPDVKNFFDKVSLNSILDIVLSVENGSDLSTVLWEEIECKMSNDELEKLDIVNIDFLLEIISTLFYEELYKYTCDWNLSYDVYFWLPDSVCLISNKDKRKSYIDEFYNIDAKF